MAKYSFQDIRTSRRRPTASKSKVEKESVKPAKSKPRASSTKKEAANQEPRDKWSSITPHTTEAAQDQSGGDYSRFGVWFAALVAVVILIVTLGGVFSGATVTIVPRQEDSIINGTFDSSQDLDVFDISHEVMILSDEESMEVAAVEEREVNRKASGIIVVYNKHSTSSQRLIKNTRFETPDGNIYRIKGSITVPGTKVENGKIIPGSVEVKVYADEPGEEYNTSLTDFTIPGFKGDPRFDTFYARSKTEITNGFKGILHYPSDEELDRATSELKNTLTERLTAQATAQKPENFILYEDAIFIEFDDLDEDLETSENTVMIPQRATLHGVIFNTSDFAKFIAKQSLASFDDSEVRIPGIQDLEFLIEDKENVSALGDDIEFTLSGNVHVVWDIDHEALKQSLIDIPKKNFQNILSEFPDIKKAEASIRPFWKRTFPDNVKDIRIEEVIEG